MSSEDMVVIARFRNLPEAQIARSRLEAEGIRCFIPNENAYSIGLPIPDVCAEVVLWVRRSDAEEALAALSDRDEKTEP